MLHTALWSLGLHVLRKWRWLCVLEMFFCVQDDIISMQCSVSFFLLPCVSFLSLKVICHSCVSRFFCLFCLIFLFVCPSLRLSLSPFSDHVPDDLRDPFYVDQYGVEHIKPPVLGLLLSAELYSRVCAFLSLSERSTTRHTHHSVLQMLARLSIHVLEPDGTPVTHHDLNSAPIRMVRMVFVC